MATKNEYLVWHPAWSADGNRVAVILMSETEKPEMGHLADFHLKVVDVNTATVLNVVEVPPGVLQHPYPRTPSNTFCWSATGERILISWASSAVVDLETDSAIKISDGYSVAEWALSGESVVFFDFDSQNHKRILRGLYHRHLDKSEAELLADRDALEKLNILQHDRLGMFDAKLSLSPSGRKLAMVMGTRKNSKDLEELRIYDLAPSFKIDLTAPTHQVAHEAQLLVHMQWSPDETQIAAFVMHDRHKFSVQVYDLNKRKWSKIADISLQDPRAWPLDFIGWHKALSWSD